MSYLDSPKKARQLYGRIISINMDKCRRFQCGGFFVNVSHPIEIVQEGAQIDKIQEGLKDGRLIDVTESHSKGLRIGGIGHSPATSEDTGKRVYITVDKNGGIALKAAETPEEIAKCEEQIKKVGIIAADGYKIAEPLGAEGRIQPGDEALVLHNLTEKVESCNLKVFGSTPIIKPGPHKVI